MLEFKVCIANTQSVCIVLLFKAEAIVHYNTILLGKMYKMCTALNTIKQSMFFMLNHLHDIFTIFWKLFTFIEEIILPVQWTSAEKGYALCLAFQVWSKSGFMPKQILWLANWQRSYSHLMPIFKASFQFTQVSHCHNIPFSIMPNIIHKGLVLWPHIMYNYKNIKWTLTWLSKKLIHTTRVYYAWYSMGTMEVSELSPLVMMLKLAHSTHSMSFIGLKV